MLSEPEELKMKVRKEFFLMLALLSGVMAIGAGANTLTIDAHSDQRVPINKHIYGVNIANWCADYYLKLCEPQLTNAGVSVVRYGATNIERYNWRNNRMYNVISQTNQFVPMSWNSFIPWVRDDLNADVFLQVPAFGHVASDYGSPNYNSNQVRSDITDWVAAAGTNVQIWGVGNEPFIAWKLEGYEGHRSTNDGAESYAYNDGAHGDQIFNEDIAADAFFPQFLAVADAIRAANPTAKILGPTPANWWLYWSTDYSPFCPATRADPGDHEEDNGWFTMGASMNQWVPQVFPDRAGNPSIVGWEKNDETGVFNDSRVMCQFAKRMAAYAAAHGGTQACDYLDFHRYMNCDQDSMAVQEVRDLWDANYASYDKETGGSGTKTMILTRFQDIIDNFNTNLQMSLSEYDYFYWQGHPAERQISALGELDYLGTFAKRGIQLACNWYIGEPDQSGGGYHHAADSAKQAMFGESGEPNPKYWAFKLMSDHFRDQALLAESDNNDTFSVYGGLDVASSQLTVVAYYKGQYLPWYDTTNAGGFIEGQANSNALLVVSNFTITGVQRVERYGRFDPYIVPMDVGGVSVAGDSFTYDFEPLAIYAFVFNGTNSPAPEETPSTFLHVTPARVDFGPYETGMEVSEGETNFSYSIKVTNNRNSNTTWSASTLCPWLEVHGTGSGTATVTDVIYVHITNKSAYAVGVYSSHVSVVTSEGSVDVPVVMEVLPGPDGGELRIFDAETHSLAHAWGSEVPYSLGFYDGHGNTEDRNDPYIYTFSMDYDDVSELGGQASLRVDFDRSAGDNSAGRLYTAFGTYGHQGATAIWVPTNASPSNYVFKFDIKSKTEGTGFTKTRFLLVITDGEEPSTNNNKGKPDVMISDFMSSIEIEDGYWQTIEIPLGTNFFDWRYPEGQDGSLVNLDFSAIRQVEFCPWAGREDKKGTIWLDNLRIDKTNTMGNLFPVAIAGLDNRLIGTNETSTFTATNSYDPDGTVASYEWSPATGLSATNVAEPTFTPPGPGVYTFNLFVVDNDGLKSRDATQVDVKVMPTLIGTSMELFRQSDFTDAVTGTASDCLDLYVKLTCSAGGNTSETDFTLARVSTTDTYGPDVHNNVDPIDIVLEETGADTKIFTGHVRLAAVSDEIEESIGMSEGVSLTVSNAGVSSVIIVGKQTYGYEKYIDHVERGNSALNNFEGAWYAYDDNYNANTSEIFMATSNIGVNAGSSQSMHGWGVLELGPTGSVDKLFAGIGTKVTRFTGETTNDVSDLSSVTGVKGISFDLRGNGKKLAVVLRSFAVTNYDDYLYAIDYTPTNGWRKYYLLFTDFEQEGWGNEAVEREDVLKLVNSIQFKFASKINNETNHIFIDNLALFGGDITYSTNVIYNEDNLVSMEGYTGITLANASFTNAGSSATTISGWSLTGNVRGETWAGDGEAVIESWNAALGSFSQEIGSDITPGDDYKFTVTIDKTADFDGSIYFDLIWRTSGGADISTNTTADLASAITTSLADQDTGWVTAPASAARVLVRVRSEGLSAGNSKASACSFTTSSKQADNDWQMWVDGFSVSYTTNCAEGNYAAQLTSTNMDWVSGMYVPPYGAGVTMTNFALYDGIAIKARRVPDYSASGDTDARIRIGIVTGTTETAKTRWFPVDGSYWEDYIIFSKDNFYTLDTADTNDPTALVEWTNSWTEIDRMYIYYGPGTNGVLPYDIILDDFRPCSGTYLH